MRSPSTSFPSFLHILCNSIPLYNTHQYHEMASLHSNEALPTTYPQNLHFILSYNIPFKEVKIRNNHTIHENVFDHGRLQLWVSEGGGWHVGELGGWTGKGIIRLPTLHEGRNAFRSGRELWGVVWCYCGCFQRRTLPCSASQRRVVMTAPTQSS